ncbi:response regulator transcription factor [Salmonella enterica]|nr:DNA-binding response regulator [Salmonella enterica subsp. enterica serovar Muenchen]EBW7189847.1 DNA-binding response regulator [Salmonella enterica subsp. enterica serovar Muenchen]EBX4463230.1 DNA-binding response regulator [Salmonella enterica subsp. enterica serovar Muenchen]EBY3557635.1 DNA-binding response regulator [Salmonella enterica subsp. enterica serovar Muenchen]EKB5404065.1 response regulator transcription factor [Salmonella enterica]
MRKIYIYGDNPEVITVMREGLKDLLCKHGCHSENAEPVFGYAGVIQNAGELLERVQKSILPPVVLLNIQPGRNILLLQALREIREGVGIAVFSPEIMYPDRIVARWFNCTLNQDTDVAEGDMGRYLLHAVRKGLMKYRRQTDCPRAGLLIPELARRMTETVKELDYILHISLLSESLTKKERTVLSYIREGRSVEQTAALTKAGRNAVGGWYRNLCERLTLQYDRTNLAENFTLLPERQNNPFRIPDSTCRRGTIKQTEGIF